MKIIEDIIFNKVQKLKSGQMLIMTDVEMDHLDNLDIAGFQYVSEPNPQQVGTLDRWLVASVDHPYMVERRKDSELI